MNTFRTPGEIGIVLVDGCIPHEVSGSIPLAFILPSTPAWHFDGLIHGGDPSP